MQGGAAESAFLGKAHFDAYVSALTISVLMLGKQLVC